MTVEQVREGLLWGAAIHYGILLLWFAMFARARPWLRRFHGRWFQMSDERFDAAHYTLMGVYKLGIFLFFLVPGVLLFLVA